MAVPSCGSDSQASRQVSGPGTGLEWNAAEKGDGGGAGEKKEVIPESASSVGQSKWRNSRRGRRPRDADDSSRTPPFFLPTPTRLEAWL